MAIINSQSLFAFQSFPGTRNSDSRIFESKVHRELSIKHGLWLSCMGKSLSESVTIKYEKRYPVIDFGFLVCGKIKKCSGSVSSEQAWENIEDGTIGIQFMHERSGLFRLEAAKEHKNLHIHMTIPFFQKLVKNEYSVFPEKLRHIIETGCQKEFSFRKTMPPDIQVVVYQILTYLNSNNSWPFYLEGKIMELLSLQIVFFFFGNNDKNKNLLLLGREDREKIHKAKSFLVKDFHNPPTLGKISIHTGLSKNKLQSGFRAIYGKTVFEYFREYRMKTAKLLLETKKTNVSQTAWEVGYINVSHFSEAFKKQFGILPKQYLKLLNFN